MCRDHNTNSCAAFNFTRHAVIPPPLPPPPPPPSSRVICSPDHQPVTEWSPSAATEWNCKFTILPPWSPLADYFPLLNFSFAIFMELCLDQLLWFYMGFYDRILFQKWAVEMVAKEQLFDTIDVTSWYGNRHNMTILMTTGDVDFLSLSECSTPSDGSWDRATLTSGWLEEGRGEPARWQHFWTF